MLKLVNHSRYLPRRYFGMRSVLSFAVAALLFAVTLLSSGTVDAGKNVCFDRTALIKHLSGKFEEAPVAAGLAANGSVLEVFSSPDGVTWTIVITQPDGATCVMASGEAWMGMKKPKKGKMS